MSDPPAAGQVFRYPYLWRRQADTGETEGRKTRPACLAVVAAGTEGGTLLFILAITTQPPMPGRTALAVPETELRRAGLSAPSWVILDEVNVDVLEGPSPSRTALRSAASAAASPAKSSTPFAKPAAQPASISSPAADRLSGSRPLPAGPFPH